MNLAIQMRKQEMKVGQDITLVSKGIRHSDYGKDWVDQTQKGRTSFFKIAKIGFKYLHGTYIYWDGGERHDRDWPSKVIMEDYIIYSGIRHDLKDRYDKYYKAIQQWEEVQEKTRRQCEWQMRDYVNKQMDKWRKENPYPQISIEKSSSLQGV